MNNETNTAARPGKTAAVLGGVILAAGAAAYVWRIPLSGTAETYGALRLCLLGAVLLVGMVVMARQSRQPLPLAAAFVTALLLDGVLYLVLAPDGSGITGTGNILLLVGAYLPSLLFGAVTAVTAKTPEAKSAALAATDTMTLITGTAVVSASVVGEIALFYLPGDNLVSVAGGKALMLFPICYCVGKGVTAVTKKLSGRE